MRETTQKLKVFDLAAGGLHDRSYAPKRVHLQRSETRKHSDRWKRIRQALWFRIQYQVWEKPNLQNCLRNLIVHSTLTRIGATIWQDHWSLRTGNSALRADCQPFSLSRDYTWEHEGNKNLTYRFWYENIHPKREGLDWSPHTNWTSIKAWLF